MEVLNGEKIFYEWEIQGGKVEYSGKNMFEQIGKNLLLNSMMNSFGNGLVHEHGFLCLCWDQWKAKVRLCHLAQHEKYHPHGHLLHRYFLP